MGRGNVDVSKREVAPYLASIFGMQASDSDDESEEDERFVSDKKPAAASRKRNKKGKKGAAGGSASTNGEEESAPSKPAVEPKAPEVSQRRSSVQGFQVNGPCWCWKSDDGPPGVCLDGGGSPPTWGRGLRDSMALLWVAGGVYSHRWRRWWLSQDGV